MVNKEKRFETIYTQGTSWSIVIDNETGVNYLVHDTSITPLLNKDGSIVITDVNKQLIWGHPKRAAYEKTPGAEVSKSLRPAFYTRF